MLEFNLQVATLTSDVVGAQDMYNRETLATKNAQLEQSVQQVTESLSKSQRRNGRLVDSKKAKHEVIEQLQAKIVSRDDMTTGLREEISQMEKYTDELRSQLEEFKHVSSIYYRFLD
jgi:chromosome segregation ATPase